MGSVERTVRVGLSALLVLVFFFPALTDGSINAGHLYTGDVAGFYLPTVLKVHSLVHGFNLAGLDYSLYNGSSDFFLSPNFFTFHPLVIVYALVVPAEWATLQSAGQLITWMAALHMLAALYFAQRLFNRFLGLDQWASFFGAAVFAFSIPMVYALYQPPFFFIATLLPWVCYAALDYAGRPGLLRALPAAVPVVLILVGGYIPLALGALAFAGIVTLASVLATRKRVLDLSVPFLIGVAVCSAYVLSLYLFHQETGSSGRVSLVYSAWQLGDSPSALLRGLLSTWNTSYSVPGPFSETSVAAGAIGVLIILAFMFSDAPSRLQRGETGSLVASAGLYVGCLLATFGVASVVSDLVYFYLPYAGQMHIYQRFGLFGHLAFAAMIALMLSVLMRQRPVITGWVLLGVLVSLTLFCWWGLTYHSTAFRKAGVIEQVVLELFCASLVTAALVFMGRRVVFVIASAMAVLPALDMMHVHSKFGNAYAAQSERQPILLKPGEAKALTGWIKARSDKQFIKYADLTPLWGPKGVESFPKVFPYLDLGTRLSSYGGFTFYLSARSEYRSRIPMTDDLRIRPDWDFLRASGVDFVVLPADQTTAVEGETYPLPDGAVLASVSRPSGSSDNGMIRVAGTILAFRSNFASYSRAEVELPSPGKLEYLFSHNPRLTYRIDGRRIEPDTSGLVPSFSLPAGRHTVEIAYSHPLLMAFWLVYALFWAGVLASLVMLLRRR